MKGAKRHMKLLKPHDGFCRIIPDWGEQVILVTKIIVRYQSCRCTLKIFPNFAQRKEPRDVGDFFQKRSFLRVNGLLCA